jgi:hypothetical protein
MSKAPVPNFSELRDGESDGCRRKIRVELAVTVASEQLHLGAIVLHR